MKKSIEQIYLKADLFDIGHQNVDFERLHDSRELRLSHSTVETLPSIVVFEIRVEQDASLRNILANMIEHDVQSGLVFGFEGAHYATKSAAWWPLGGRSRIFFQSWQVESMLQVKA